MRIGFRFQNPTGTITLSVRFNGGSDAFVLSEVFEHSYYNFPLFENPNTVLDLGANIGLTGVFFARKYPDSEFAFVEPMPDNIAILTENVLINKIRAVIVAKAISVADGELSMACAEMDYGHKPIGIGFGKEITGECIKVHAISVPSLMSELGWERIGLLKIDIEGYEGILLRENCEWLHKVDNICIECHEGFGEADLAEIARKYRFTKPKSLPGIWMLERTANHETCTPIQ